MKKMIALLVVLATVCSLAACNGTNGPADTSGTPVELDLQQIFTDMSAATDETMTLIDAERLDYTYGIAPEDCAEVYVYSHNSGMMAAEIWLIKASSADALARLKALAENRLKSLDEESASYSPEMNKVVKKAQIICRGDYLAMICSTEVDALATIFNNA